MCIILGAMFQIIFHVSMDTAKDIVENNIMLVVHQSQILIEDFWRMNPDGSYYTRNGQIVEFLILNETCSWTYANDDFNDECSCIKMLADKAGGRRKEGGIGSLYEEIIKFGLLREGKYAIMKSYLTQHELTWGERYNQGMGWHRSDERVYGINPYRGYLTNKKWIYNEDITIFISILLVYLL